MTQRNTWTDVLLLAGAWVVLCAILVAAPASAHHVGTAATASDLDALGSYVKEYRTQREPIVPLAAEQTLRPSPSGLAEVRNAIDVTIEHMESLDVRPCFATVAALAQAEFEALARSLHRDADPLMAQSWRNISNYFASLVPGEVAVAVVTCTPEAAA